MLGVPQSVCSTFCAFVRDCEMAGHSRFSPEQSATYELTAAALIDRVPFSWRSSQSQLPLSMQLDQLLDSFYIMA